MDTTYPTLLLGLLPPPLRFFPMMTYPTVTSQDSYLQALEDIDSGIEGAREVVIAAQLDLNILLSRSYIHDFGLAPIPSMDPLLHSPMQLDEPGPSQFPWILPLLVFMGTPISQPTIETPAMGTLAGGAETELPPCYFPPRAKLVKKHALTEHVKLSIFDILNTFWCCWFLSVSHLQAQALLAQKADNRKIFWVEFAP
jgi:hypothetical protein